MKCQQTLEIEPRAPKLSC